jgi:hypothetical protein
VQVRITTGEQRWTATLDDNATARDFAALLPLSLPLSDYAGTEKISDLPRKLTTAGAPQGITPQAGDLAYYAPWGNLAIFYQRDRYASGLVRLGRITEGVEALAPVGSLLVRIEHLQR